MPSLSHKLLISVLRKFPVPDAIGLGLKKNIVVRQDPTEKQIKKHHIIKTQFDGRDIYNFGTPQNGEPILYFCHGGGYVTGLFSAYYDGIGRLKSYVEAPVVCPDYPMPPETNAQGVIDFTLSHFRHVREQYPDSPIIISGDSAGGHLTLTLTQALTSKERRNLKAIFPLFPVVDMRKSADDYAYYKEEVLLKKENMHPTGVRFVGDFNPENPIVSPILGNLSDLPPTHIYSGDRDPLAVDSLELKAAMDDLTCEASHHIFEGYGHDFVLFFPTSDSKKGLKRIANHMQTCFRS